MSHSLRFPRIRFGLKGLLLLLTLTATFLAGWNRKLDALAREAAYARAEATRQAEDYRRALWERETRRRQADMMLDRMEHQERMERFQQELQYVN